MQIVPSKTTNNSHEFIITSRATSRSNLAANTIPSRYSLASDHKKERPRRQPRPRRPKQPTLVNRETQTSANEDDEEVTYQDQLQTSSAPKTYPSMGTSHLLLRTQVSPPTSESIDSKPISSKYYTKSYESKGVFYLSSEQKFTRYQRITFNIAQ